MTYQEFKEAVIRYAGENGIADYELYYSESESTSVEIYQEEVKGYSTENSSGRTIDRPTLIRILRRSAIPSSMLPPSA